MLHMARNRVLAKLSLVAASLCDLFKNHSRDFQPESHVEEEVKIK